MTALLLRGDARRIPLGDETVDLIVTSPSYYRQRSYRDGGEHVAGQLGDEPHPQQYLEALWAITAECWRVLKPRGSMWINLGDKRSGSGAPGTTSGLSKAGSTLQGRSQQDGGVTDLVTAARAQVQGARSQITGSYGKAAFGRAKSKMLLPHRYAIGCEDGLADPDGLGWIVRQDQVWSKPNGMPESVTDRTRDSHEYWFHLAKQGDYFAGIDAIREPHSGYERNPAARATPTGQRPRQLADTCNPLGKVPASVWTVATQPLTVPDDVGLKHHAAYPMVWPRRIISGWSPAAICTACQEPRRATTESEVLVLRRGDAAGRAALNGEDVHGADRRAGTHALKQHWITGEACACPDTTALTRPAVVFDPFGGTGTTALVADALGRTGITMDLSGDYLRLAAWRTTDPKQMARARGDKPPPAPRPDDGLPTLFDTEATA